MSGLESQKVFKSTKKISFQEVFTAFEQAKYKLLTKIEEYKNTSQKLHSVCPNGHNYFVDYYNFARREFRCPICGGFNKKYTLEKVKEIFGKEGYELLSSSYQKNTAPLHVRCPEGHEWSVSLNNFMSRNSRCPDCICIVSTPVIETRYDPEPFTKKIAEFLQQDKEFLDWVKTYYPSADEKRVSGGANDVIFDVFIPEIKLAINIYDEEHSCELTDYTKRLAASENLKIAKHNDWELISVFGNEWKARNSQVKNLLLSKFISHQNRIYARKCQIKEIDAKTCDEFLNHTHIQGKVKSIIRIGLFDKDKLIAVMTGSRHHRINGNTGILVLSRFAVASGYSIPGGASKLLAGLKKAAVSMGYYKIVSWSDNRFSVGNVYNKLGFRLEEELKPDYFYVKNGEIRSKQSFQKKNLLKMGATGNTEREMAISLGWYRVWDCGKIRWGMMI